MKKDQVFKGLRVETNDSALRRCNRLLGSQKGIIVDGIIKKEKTTSKILVLFDSESSPRYVAISRLKAKTND